MASRTSLSSGVRRDDQLPVFGFTIASDGYLAMSTETWSRIHRGSLNSVAFPHMFALMNAGLVGDFVLPDSVLQDGAGIPDIARALRILEPGPSDVCVFPPCGQAATVVHAGGFPLCVGHATELTDWERLLTA